jgi:hypothetical protein
MIEHPFELDEDDMIRFTCECGKQLQAREENAGRHAVCPSCGQQTLIPAANEDAIQQRDTARSESPDSEKVQRKRPALSSAEEDFDRPATPAGSSGKAMASLILGILSLFCNVLTGLPAIILGLLALRDISKSRGRLSGHGLAIGGIVSASVCMILSCVIAVPIGLLLPAVQKVREAASRMQSQNNLKQLGLAMHNYHDSQGRFPAAAICDPNGKPLLSWRVAILPYLGENNLYNRFRLNEPWDSPNNIQLAPLMPKVYKLPQDSNSASDQTHYQVFVGNGAAFDPTKGFRISVDFPDGLANTILIVEAAPSVTWTKPDDITFDPGKPIAPLLSDVYRSGCNVLLGDGSVRPVLLSTPDSTLKAAITRNGGERVQLP